MNDKDVKVYKRYLISKDKNKKNSFAVNRKKVVFHKFSEIHFSLKFRVHDFSVIDKKCVQRVFTNQKSFQANRIPS